jgi:hypothetical protein
MRAGKRAIFLSRNLDDSLWLKRQLRGMLSGRKLGVPHLCGQTGKYSLAGPKAVLPAFCLGSHVNFCGAEI